MTIRRAGFLLVLLALVPLSLRAAEPPTPTDTVAKAVAALYEGIREETLPNGLRVIFKPIPESPTVTVMTAYRVGSADEELTQTGLSHYLEHLMFKGTEKLLPGDIDKLTRRAGGQNNAYTTNDFTNFHFDLPAGKWETALAIEADRMRNLRIDEKHEFEQEKGAVIAELDGNEDEPWDLENKALLPLLYGEKTPYGHPVIGVKSHVRAATAAIIKSHYDKWYHPNNATVVMVGGFDPERALTKIKDLFGPIPKAPLPERKTAAPVERAKPAAKTIPSKLEVDRLLMGFNTVKVGDPEDYVLDVIEHILSSGKTGRLYRRLVLAQRVAGEVTCSNQTGRHPGWFSIQMEVMKGTDPKTAEAALLAELRTLAVEPVTDAELKKVVRNIVAGLIFAREGTHELADSIVIATAASDLNYLKTYIARLQAVTATDVQAVAKKYLNPDKRATVLSKPDKASGGRESPVSSLQPGAYAARSPRRFPKDTSPLPLAAAAKLEAAKRVVLPNGLTLLLLENRRLPIVFAEVYVGKVRLREPADKAGVAALVGALLEEGTEKRTETQIAHAIEDSGGILVMTATGGRVKVLSPDRALGFDLLVDCLTRSTFPKEAVKRLREHLLSEIEDAKQQPNSRAQEEFLERVYGDHPLGRPLNGTEDTVEKLTAKDCKEFHRTVFAPNNATMIVVGDFDTTAIVKELTDLTRHWTKRDLPKLDLPAPPMPDKFVQKIIPMESAAQLNLYLGHPGIRRNNPDYYKLQVMDNVLDRVHRPVVVEAAGSAGAGVHGVGEHHQHGKRGAGGVHCVHRHLPGQARHREKAPPRRDRADAHRSADGRGGRGREKLFDGNGPVPAGDQREPGRPVAAGRAARPGAGLFHDVPQSHCRGHPGRRTGGGEEILEPGEDDPGRRRPDRRARPAAEEGVARAACGFAGSPREAASGSLDFPFRPQP